MRVQVHVSSVDTSGTSGELTLADSTSMYTLMTESSEVLFSGIALCYAFAGSATMVDLPADSVYAIAGSALTEGAEKLSRAETAFSELGS